MQKSAFVQKIQVLGHTFTENACFFGGFFCQNVIEADIFRHYADMKNNPNMI